MKCPEMYKIMQHNIRKPILDDDNLVIETQGFSECYKENCAAWDKEKQMCRKVGGE